MFMRMLLCCAVAAMLVGCSSSKNAAAPAGGSSGSTTATAGGTPGSSSASATTAGGSSDVSTTTAGGGSGGPKSTGAFCTDVRNGAVQTALGDAANPNPADNSLDQLKKIDNEAPSEIKSAVHTLFQLLTQIHDAGTDAAKQAALTSGGPQLQTAATSIGNYISTHC
jgi:hypothetical protein